MVWLHNCARRIGRSDAAISQHNEAVAAILPPALEPASPRSKQQAQPWSVDLRHLQMMQQQYLQT
ncbi:MAG: hypothetical protein ACRD3W_07770, partial [Terriglobales bacterium]